MAVGGPILWFLALGLIGVVVITPWWAIVEVRRQRRELQALRDRLQALESHAARSGATLSVVPTAAIGTPPIAPLPTPIPLAVAPTPPPSPPPPPPAAALAPIPAPATHRGFDTSHAEQVIGSVWLQNVGAVLLLLGVFFLILWGYTTGRLGAGVLVAAGAALGLALAWRGDRMARSLPLLGHALIGVGLGTIYLSLYLGHFTLHALPTPMAFVSLALVAIGAVAVGLHYRVQTIAALGVFGAFVPQLMAAWIPLQGFSMSAPGLLGYLAAANAAVFLLAARAGWSGLDLTALILSAVTWTAQHGQTSWGWGVETGLTALFVALGVSPLPRLVRSGVRVRGVDLAVIALAPLALVGASWPMLAALDARSSAVFLAVLAILYLLAALWVDVRRPERDLWRPLTGAAIAFATAALERALGPEHTPMVWCAEGTILLWLGLGPRGAWLRFCGTAVTALGALWILAWMFVPGAWSLDEIPVLYAVGIRDLVGLASVLAGAGLLARGRAHLHHEERQLPELWAGLGNLMLMVWTGREALHLGVALAGDGGRWALPLAAGRLRTLQLQATLASAAWLVQSLVLIVLGRRAGGGFLRGAGHAITGIASFVLMLGLMPDGWNDTQLPILHPVGIIALAAIALIATVAVVLARARARLAVHERRAPEGWGMVASLVLMAWIALEATHLAHSISRGAEPVTHVQILSASFTSAGWLTEALFLLAIGWIRGSAFLRWVGLGLAGLTVLKFLIVDLQTVDVFWRFLTAIVAGAALLGISYEYQRRAREARGAK
jgi:uncharacterized membrane protein